MPLNERFLSQLERLVPVRRDEPMSRHTTLHVGGPAAAYVSVTDTCLLRSVVHLAREGGVPLFLLGAGSNLLVSDQGIDALVIDTWANNQGLPPAAGGRQPAVGGAGRQPATPGSAGVPPAGGRGGAPPNCQLPTGTWVYAGSPLPRLAHQAAAAGLSGLEWAVGVPGTAGGGAVNNAGAHGAEMADIAGAVRVFDGREERILPGDSLGYAYRTSRFRREETGLVVLEVELLLPPDDPAAIRSRIDEFSAYRRSTQPSQLSVGSIFKNPPGEAAGRLIERAGLKGRRIGDAEVSPKHGNFIVNRGAARASDVNELVLLVQRTVKETFNIDLEPEIQRAGEGW